MVMVFESPDRGDVIFCVIIVWLSIMSMIIFSSIDEPIRSRRQGKIRGPVFIGGKGCGCGACAVGAGVCGTYLS
ncbi:uncharacterized protein LOC109718654 [Ananas comosus]|uniref:Uncharacterized protein LOC109718654 n=1 Tax=Ananas comosus TaxID=4615 RepID=A0A199VRL2_ANACO|nr:uncharacterized protein LOC109718654 [Ananas comosus]OAY79330.1 hypothetical protein ACMD2_11192 [Ananas comosus]